MRVLKYVIVVVVVDDYYDDDGGDDDDVSVIVVVAAAAVVVYGLIYRASYFITYIYIQKHTLSALNQKYLILYRFMTISTIYNIYHIIINIIWYYIIVSSYPYLDHPGRPSKSTTKRLEDAQEGPAAEIHHLVEETPLLMS